MTGAEMLERINREMSLEYSWDELQPLLNEGLDDLSPAARRQCQATAETVPGYSDYELPDDYIDMISLWVGDRRYGRLDESAEDVPENQRPRGYIVWPGRFKIQPAPDDAAIITLNYFSYLPHLDDAEEEPDWLPRHYHRALIWYAISNLSFRHGNTERMQHAEMQYEKIKSELDEEMRRRDRRRRRSQVNIVRRLW